MEGHGVEDKDSQPRAYFRGPTAERARIFSLTCRPGLDMLYHDGCGGSVDLLAVEAAVKR